jgi:hypothetical protein
MGIICNSIPIICGGIYTNTYSVQVLNNNL